MAKTKVNQLVLLLELENNQICIKNVKLNNDFDAIFELTESQEEYDDEDVNLVGKFTI
tara:strand:- start:446 stop:619 length:174 start_codon:yes stop_codon:yes gene_type:complete